MRSGEKAKRVIRHRKCSSKKLSGICEPALVVCGANRERRVISYYVGKLYAVSKSFAKRQLDTAAKRALSCLFFFSSAVHSELLSPLPRLTCVIGERIARRSGEHGSQSGHQRFWSYRTQYLSHGARRRRHRFCGGQRHY